ncbi:MAG: glucose 1-dehydrogenase [Planctomycetes bacterium]|nr:glucose 1-dehydrogenase [Planctomycetota bacterium]
MTTQATNQTLPLQNKVALITGGTSGIGRATALLLAESGASVVIGARRAAEGADLVKEIESKGGRALFQTTDVTEAKQLNSLVDIAVKTYGGLDIAFNNAGFVGEGLLPLVEETEENLRNIMDVNFFGVWNAMKAEVPALTDRGGGVIINTTSVAGVKGFAMFSSYVSSKFAVEGLSRSIAQEVAELGIRINTIAPGPIDTDLLDQVTNGDQSMFTQYVPMQRAGTPEEVAKLVRFLASDDASYVTGHTLRADGGMMS